MNSFRLVGEVLRATVESTSSGAFAFGCGRIADASLSARAHRLAEPERFPVGLGRYDGSASARADRPGRFRQRSRPDGQRVRLVRSSTEHRSHSSLSIDRPAEVLLVSPRDLLPEEELVALARVLQTCMLVARRSERANLRVEQLQTLLELAISWHRTHDLTELLNNMAKAAARVLQADRASIFLWDRVGKELVGHPALGVEGSPLRIPDDQGIAGQVLKHGVPMRWDASDDPRAINERVGKQLGYATRSLLAVQLVDNRGRAMGVFEVLNRREGCFTAEDELFLIELAKHAGAALENIQRIDELVRTRDRLVKSASAGLELVGNCPQIDSLRQTIARVAPTDLAVLILGENGTGKEVVSRSLHLQSKRNSQAFVAVNCAAIAETLLGERTVGHEKGAFTDAIASRAGKFELARAARCYWMKSAR